MSDDKRSANPKPAADDRVTTAARNLWAFLLEEILLPAGVGQTDDERAVKAIAFAIRNEVRRHD